MREPPEKRQPRLLEAARGAEFDGSPATIDEQDSLASNDVRRCERCLCRVENSNLGGFSGKGSLSGRLYCIGCVDLLDRERFDRHECIKAAQLKVAQTAKAELEAILAEFTHLEELLLESWVALKALRFRPHLAARQRRVLLLARLYSRDATVLVHGFHRRHW
jgi:hypothetical protein